MRRRYRLTVMYDGTDFCGWQKQEPPGREALRTAQGVLETAVARTVRQPVVVTGASRTDSGVHALGQVVAFDAETTIPVERLHLAINKHLPEDIAVTGASEAPADFDPIAQAISKSYRYTIHDASLRPVFDRRRVYHCWYTLDEARMHEATQHLIGEHDFASFANTHHGRESTVRMVHACAVTRQGERVHIDIAGGGFLYHMVRIVSGTLVEIGRGVWSPADVPRILAARSRAAAGPTLSPEGLCLMTVRYASDPD